MSFWDDGNVSFLVWNWQNASPKWPQKLSTLFGRFMPKVEQKNVDFGFGNDHKCGRKWPKNE